MHEAQDSSPSSLAPRIDQALVSGTWGDTPQSGTSFNFKAFISYKHAVSTGFALQLEQSLKAYAKPLLTRPIRIFRDEKHFVPGNDLPKLIVDALDASEFLILLASPEAAVSPWVHDELAHWCGKLKRTQNLIIVLVGGEIASNNETKQIDWTRTTALPSMLESYLERVPLYLDMSSVAQVDDLTLSHPDFKKAVNSIIARFRGIDPNEMLGKEVLQHRRNLWLRNGAVAVLVVLALVSATAAYIAATQKKQAKLNQSASLGRKSLSLLNEHKDLKAFVQAIKAGKILQSQHTTNPEGLNALQAVLAEGREKNRLQGHENQVMSVSFSPDGKTLASGSYDQTIKLWDLETGQIRTLKGHDSEINSVNFSPDSKTLASGSYDQTIKLWNVETGKEIRTFKGHDSQVLRVSFSPDGKTLASGNDHGTIKLWNLETGQIRTLKGYDNHSQVWSVSFSPNGKTLASDSNSESTP